MSLKMNYVDNGDSPYEITYKNKENIIALSRVIDSLPTGTEFADLKTLVGSYSQDVANDLDETKSVIENLSIVASNLKSALARIKSNEEEIALKENSSDATRKLALKESIIDNDAKLLKKADLTHVDAQDKALDNRVQQLETDGIGGYLGTFKGVNVDDTSVLPQSANDLERVVLEFLDVDEIKYQEYQWKTGKWNKLGVVTDSHIHSQSTGITLTDVANQQDPKNLKLFFAKTDYEEKEITITPAIYGWKDIPDYDTKQYTQEDIGKKVRITSGAGISSGLISATGDSMLPKINVHLGTFFTDSGQQQQAFYSSEFPIKVGEITLSKDPAINIKEFDQDISTFEIWDIITPAVKATVLVKK